MFSSQPRPTRPAPTIPATNSPRPNQTNAPERPRSRPRLTTKMFGMTPIWLDHGTNAHTAPPEDAAPVHCEIDRLEAPLRLPRPGSLRNWRLPTSAAQDHISRQALDLPIGVGARARVARRRTNARARPTRPDAAPRLPNHCRKPTHRSRRGRWVPPTLPRIGASCTAHVRRARRRAPSAAARHRSRQRDRW
jgi:hypothetical protein